MSKKDENKNEEPVIKQEEENLEPQEAQEVNEEQEQPEGDENAETPEEKPEVDPVEQLQQQLEHEKKEYLFLMAEFDNFRKRTLKEKQELIKDGARRAMEALLPVIDDMERAIDAIDKGGDLDSLKEGVDLIYNKFMAYLKSQNVTPIESTGELFDTDLHEAVTTFPAPSDDMKGKVIDTVTRGYMINDKVLRHAKVVVGQ